jgi:hypothetical protein
MLNKNMRSMYYLTAHIQKNESRFVYKKFKHNKCHICNFNAKVVFLSFLKILFCVQFDGEKSLHTPFPFSMRKLCRVGK